MSKANAAKSASKKAAATAGASDGSSNSSTVAATTAGAGVGDTPIDREKQGVPITYRKAQAVETLVTGLGYPMLPDQGSIGINARNSGVPSTEAEARRWQATVPPFTRREPITPASFGAGPDAPERSIQECIGLPGTDSDTYDFNFDYRVCILVMNANTEGPRAVVMTADDFTDDAGELVDVSYAASLLQLRFNARNPLNTP